ncbi:MAG TPA: hypothetical protein ENI60_04355 [Candidatus Fraserbacteria bacterium]|nr:hypothetical protein [Candidatus Fraserbacteria bacterium]
MTLATLIGIFFALCGAGLLATLVLPERQAPRVLAWSGALASFFILWAGAAALLGGESFRLSLWTLPLLGRLSLGLDRMGGLFLLIGGLVTLPVSVFSLGYLQRYQGKYNLRAFGLLYLALLASLALIPLAADAFTFLIAWEAMSLLSFFLVAFEHERQRAVQAGYLMLAVGELGTLAVALAFLLLAGAAGGLDFPALRASSVGLGATMRWTIFLLSFFGFGVKAGLVPVNFWLPRAHPEAPGNVSALLSAVILNLGIYGILRFNGDLLPINSVGPGLVVLAIGVLSALVGILYATIENDLKTLLAHSSIENMGIITASLGAGFIFTATGHPVPAAIAFLAALYHLVNHSVYKALLFLGAGTLDAQLGTRDLDRLGGLLKRMPWLGLFMLIGALSIAGLPPLGGFVSEWLSLQVMLRSVELASVGIKVAFALAGVGLALTLALAVTCFVKTFAMGFLGLARSEVAEAAREGPRSALIPLGFLAGLCLLLGLGATYVIPALDGVVRPLAGTSAAAALVPPFFATHPKQAELPPAFAADFHDLGAQLGKNFLPGRGLVVLHRGGAKNPVIFAMSTAYTFVVLLLLLLVVYLAVHWGPAWRRQVTYQPRWAGGLKKLLPEMTYTATGFANPVRVIFEAIFRPTVVENTQDAAREHFRTLIRREHRQVHLIDRLVLKPIAWGALAIADGLARMHHGRINAYAGYGLLVLLIVLILARLL